MMTGGLATTMERRVCSPPTTLSLMRKKIVTKPVVLSADDHPSRFGLMDVWSLVDCDC